MRQTDAGALIAQLRKEQGLTQKQLAEQLHISDRTISKWERGAGFPDVSLLEPLADALHCSVVSLLEGRLVEEPAEIDVRSADTGEPVRSAAGLEPPVRDTLLSADSGLCDLWNFGSQRRVSSKGRAVLYSWDLAGWRENRRNSRYDFRGTKHQGTELRWAVCHRRSGENLSGTHAGNDPLGEEKQLRQYHIC